MHLLLKVLSKDVVSLSIKPCFFCAHFKNLVLNEQCILAAQ